MNAVRFALVVVLLTVGSQAAAHAAAGSISQPTSDVPMSKQFDLGQSRDDMAYFVGPVVDDVNAYWADVFATSDLSYSPVDWAVVLAGYAVPSHCGGTVGDPAEGPYAPAFYCPLGGEHRSGALDTPVVYLSAPWLFNDIAAVGAVDYDFAIATIVAHEVGHHVEEQLGYFNDGGTTCCGYSDKQTELAADCFAGNWAEDADAAGQLNVGDVSEALAVSHMSGSDFPSPEGTPGDHGTRQDRVDAWTLGFESGDPGACLTTYLPD